MKITLGDFDDPQVRQLIARHLRGMHEITPAEFVFALDLSSLQKPDISFYTAWENQDLLAMGALRELDAQSGEIKSMRTNDAFLRYKPNPHSYLMRPDLQTGLSGAGHSAGAAGH